jgi:uncharacterized protein (TIGR02266 family)
MADDRSRKLTGAVPATPPGQVSRDPRATVEVPVRYRYETFTSFVDTQSMNISRSGMFISSRESMAVGTSLDFELLLADGFSLLRGKGQVARVSVNPPGLGIRFQQLDEPSRKLLDRILEINAQEDKRPTVPLEFPEAPPSGQLKGLMGATKVSPGVAFDGRDLRLEINTTTAGYFTNNPLLNIRLGGFVVPGQEDVPLGTVYTLQIEDAQGTVLWTGKGKVVAKHEMRLGIRMIDVPKDVLARLQSEVTRAAPPK